MATFLVTCRAPGIGQLSSAESCRIYREREREREREFSILDQMWRSHRVKDELFVTLKLQHLYDNTNVSKLM